MSERTKKGLDIGPRTIIHCCKFTGFNSNKGGGTSVWDTYREFEAL